MSALPLVPVAIQVNAGMTVLIPCGNAVGDYHLHVVVFDPKVVDGVQKVLLSPFQTQFPKADISCLLNIGDHIFVTRPTIIGYGWSRSDPLSHVVQCLNNGAFINNHPPVSAALLNRIQQGYAITKRVKKFIRNEWP